jgi:hypothetical protein
MRVSACASRELRFDLIYVKVIVLADVDVTREDDFQLDYDMFVFDTIEMCIEEQLTLRNILQKEAKLVPSAIRAYLSNPEKQKQLQEYTLAVLKKTTETLSVLVREFHYEVLPQKGISRLV